MIKKIYLCVMTFLLAFVLVPMNIQAEENCMLSLPITLEVTGNAPTNATYTFEIQAVSEGAPLPANTTVTMTGAGTVTFDPITYTVPNDYVYKIVQTTASIDQMTLDTSEYEVTVRVLNEASGGLNAVWAQKNGSTDKVDEIKFVNASTAKTVTPSKTKTSKRGSFVNTATFNDIVFWSLILGGSFIFLFLFGYSRKKKYEHID